MLYTKALFSKISSLNFVCYGGVTEVRDDSSVRSAGQVCFRLPELECV